jgi:hypothetical protein
MKSDDAPALERLADGSGFRVRVRFGRARNRYRIPSIDEAFAAKRAAVLVEVGAALASQPPELGTPCGPSASSARRGRAATLRASTRIK